MKLLQSCIDGKDLEINRTFFGKETVLVNNKMVSKKQTLFGTNHNFEINGKNYKLNYKVKNAWKKILGKPVFVIYANDFLVSENFIKNRVFLSIQFLLGFAFTYCFYLVLTMVIQSAKNGFVFNAH